MTDQTHLPHPAPESPSTSSEPASSTWFAVGLAGFTVALTWIVTLTARAIIGAAAATQTTSDADPVAVPAALLVLVAASLTALISGAAPVARADWRRSVPARVSANDVGAERTARTSESEVARPDTADVHMDAALTGTS